MTYAINHHKYVILLIYASFAVSLSAVIKQDVFMLLNVAIIGALASFFLVKKEMILLVTTILVSIFNEGIMVFNATYIVFYLYALMVISLLLNKEKNKVHYGILITVLLSFVLSLTPSIVNGASIPLLLVSALKRYGFVIVFVYALNIVSLKENYKKIIDFSLLALLFVNFVFAFFQYLGGEQSQDAITGLMGYGTSGIFIYLLMFYLAVASGLHYQQKISTAIYAGLAVVPIIYSAVAEVKIGFVSTAVLLFVYLVFIKRGYKAFILLVVSGLAMTWMYSFFVSLYPEHDFLDRNFLESYLVEEAYGGGDTLNRIGFKPAVDALIFTDSQNEMLFGKGLGAGNPSELDFLAGDIYRNFDYLKYSWFALPYLYIEAGLVGGIAFFLIYLLPLLISVREFIRRRSSLAIVLMLMGLTNIFYLPYNSGLFSYAVTTVYWIYVAMLIQENDKRQSDVPSP